MKDTNSLMLSNIALALAVLITLLLWTYVVAISL
jgi:hypothetical protein